MSSTALPAIALSVVLRPFVVFESQGRGLLHVHLPLDDGATAESVLDLEQFGGHVCVFLCRFI
jgi:hypothetical protein